MKKIIAIFCSFLFYSVHANAQDKRDFTKEYENFRKQAQQEYSNFRDKANSEYAEFMRQAWQWYEGEAAIPLPKIPDNPKPPVIMPEKDRDKIPENNPIPYEEVIPAPVVIEQPKPVAPIPEISKQKKEEWHNFTVFGTTCKVRLSNEDRFTLPDCKENTVADAWKKLSQPQYNNLIRDCLELRIRMNLCDWAYLQMLQQLSYRFLGENTNEATLLTAFLYTQSGYKMRLARSQSNKLYLLVASQHVLYGVPYYKIGTDNFFPLN